MINDSVVSLKLDALYYLKKKSIYKILIYITRLRLINIFLCKQKFSWSDKESLREGYEVLEEEPINMAKASKRKATRRVSPDGF